MLNRASNSKARRGTEKESPSGLKMSGGGGPPSVLSFGLFTYRELRTVAVEKIGVGPCAGGLGGGMMRKNKDRVYQFTAAPISTQSSCIMCRGGDRLKV